MLDDLLTSCALVLVAAGVVAVAAEAYDDAKSPATKTAALEVIELPTVTVIGRREAPASPELLAAAAK